jgi:hypothetical protein
MSFFITTDTIMSEQKLSSGFALDASNSKPEHVEDLVLAIQRIDKKLDCVITMLNLIKRKTFFLTGAMLGTPHFELEIPADFISLRAAVCCMFGIKEGEFGKLRDTHTRQQVLFKDIKESSYLYFTTVIEESLDIALSKELTDE